VTVPTRWIAPTLIGCAIAAFVASLPFRGTNLWGVWLLDVADAFWRLRHESGDASAAYANPHGIFPLLPWLSALVDDRDATLGALRVLSAVSAGFLVAVAYRWAASVAGWVAGLSASILLACAPPFLAAVTQPGLTAPVAASLVVVWSLTRATCRDARWTPLLWLASAVAAQLSAMGWWLWLPLLWFVMVRPSHGVSYGLVRLREVPIGALMAPVVGIGSLLAHPWFREHTADRIGELLSVWLRRPAEPVLAEFVLFGSERIPWWLPLRALWADVPMMFTLLFGLVAVRIALGFVLSGWSQTLKLGPSDALRWLVGAFVAAAVLPVVLRSTFNSGLSLSLFVLVPGAALAGLWTSWAVHSAPAVPKNWLGGALIFALAVLSVPDALRSWPVPESYASELVGGVVGNVEAGYSRCQHAALPPRVYSALETAAPSRRIAILSNAWEAAPTLQRYAAIASDSAWQMVDVHDADAVLVVYDDALPELYQTVQNLADMGLEPAWELSIDGVRLYAVYRLP
jgi:hypothetical protein